MPQYLNQELGFDEVRWATMRKTSYDSSRSFQGAPEKTLLPVGTRLYRLVPIVTGKYFDEVWWMPRDVFEELHNDANKAGHGGAVRQDIHGADRLPRQRTTPASDIKRKASPHRHSCQPIRSATGHQPE